MTELTEVEERITFKNDVLTNYVKNSGLLMHHITLKDYLHVV